MLDLFFYGLLTNWWLFKNETYFELQEFFSSEFLHFFVKITMISLDTSPTIYPTTGTYFIELHNILNFNMILFLGLRSLNAEVMYNTKPFTLRAAWSRYMWQQWDTLPIFAFFFCLQWNISLCSPHWKTAFLFGN